MRILIIAEHQRNTLKPSTLHAISAAKKIASHVTVLVVGHACTEVAQQCQTIDGVSNVMLADHDVYEHRLAENTSALIHAISPAFQGIFAGSSTFSKNLLPRVAALLNENMLTDVSDIIDPHTFVRPIYAGNALMTITMQYQILVATIRCPSFPAASFQSNFLAPLEHIDLRIENTLSFFSSEEETHTTRPELTHARIVVSGGRGLKSKEQFCLIEQLADQLGAAVGASRAAVDAGFAPNDYQVGQTGKTVAPDLYIAIGISGAIQHVAGIKDSKTIIAINQDSDAPIFSVADVGLVGDLFVLIPELQEKLKSEMEFN